MWYLVLVLSLTQYSQAICPKGCEKYVSLYEDIGCKPVYDKPEDCCPERYDCSSREGRPTDQCLLRGKLYKIHEDIPNDLFGGTCNAACLCRDWGSGAQFTCAVVDCPEFLGVPGDPGCLRKYELNSCCSVGQICPPFDNLAKCEVNGKTFYEGQKLPVEKDQCQECVCKKGFKGEFVEPFCKPTECFTELRHADNIDKSCAVVYIEGSKCCPYTFVCPEAEDHITKAKKAQEGGPTCKYGEKRLGLGDKFQRTKVLSTYDKIETKCKCVVPPLVTCVEEHVYDLDKTPDFIKRYITQ